MDSAGNVLFAILVVVFVLGTYALALSIESIIEQWSRLRRQRWKAKGVMNSGSKRQAHGADPEHASHALGGYFGMRRRQTSDEMDEKIFRAA